MNGSDDVTRILRRIDSGEANDAAELLPLIYADLRRLAARKIAAERRGYTLDATALVHEAYLRLVGQQRFDSRRHFFAAAAEAMRRILIERARRRISLKSGGGRGRVELDESAVAAPERGGDLLALDAALARLAVAEPEVAELVRLRYFAGLTTTDAAEVLEISLRSADRRWAFAKAWLLRELEPDA